MWTRMLSKEEVFISEYQIWLEIGKNGAICSVDRAIPAVRQQITTGESLG